MPYSILMVCLLYCPNFEQVASQPKRILFIGNSLTYTNELPVLVQQLFVSLKKPKPFVEAFTEPGASLGDHWQLPRTGKRIVEGKWDYIILQQGSSTLAASQKEFMKDMETGKQYFKKTKAKVCLYMVWPETNRKQYFPQVRQAYANAAKAVDGLFLPAGIALQQVQENAPHLALFTDGLHPTPLGTFLAGYVIAAKLTGTDAEQLPAQFQWKQHEVKLNQADYQICLEAVRSALKDEGN